MRIYEHNKKHITLLALVFGTICILVLSILLYNMYISEVVKGLSNSNVEQVVTHQANTFKESFTADINLLETTASLLTMSDYHTYIDFEHAQDEYLLASFDYLMVIDKDGYAFGSDTTLDDLSGRTYFQQALAGNTVISEPIVSAFDNKESIVIATPMLDDNEIVGVLAGIIYLESLTNMFGTSDPNAIANVIVDSNGTIIANGLEGTEFVAMENLYDILKAMGELDENRLNNLNSDITFGLHGNELLVFDDSAYSAIYCPVGIEDWVIISIIPNNIVQHTTNIITIVTSAMSIGIVLVVGIFGLLIFNSQRKSLEKITEIAYTSDLTKISTAAKFKIDSNAFIKRHKDKNFVLIKFDVENFKLVNETLGSSEGDRVLISMAKAINFKTDINCIYAHLHDDEFIVMLAYGVAYNPEQWRDDYVNHLYNLLGVDFTYKLRIVTGYYFPKTDNMFSIDSAIEKANVAHRRAKAIKTLSSIYSDELLTSAVKNKELENRMEKALENREFVMVLQPELSLTTGNMIAAEALVRWQTDDGPMRPDEFIPLFEQNGFITKLDLYMFEEACRYLSRWVQAGREEIIISVNFSRNHLHNLGLEKKLLAICEKYNVKPQCLGIEITETSMISNEVDILDFIRRIKEHGFKVLMDDFGSGYSSLGLLKDIPVDILKLDRSFFSQTEDRSRSLAVVSSIIKLSKDLGILTIAEGVETVDDLINLKEMNCDIIQGYYYSKPMSQEAFIRFYESDASKVDVQ